MAAEMHAIASQRILSRPQVRRQDREPSLKRAETLAKLVGDAASRRRKRMGGTGFRIGAIAQRSQRCEACFRPSGKPCIQARRNRLSKIVSQFFVADENKAGIQRCVAAHEVCDHGPVPPDASMFAETE